MFEPHTGGTAGAAERPTPDENDRLADEIAELAAHLHAATWRLLTLLREYDAREAWGWGFRSCAHWLSWRTGIAPGAAREKVRVARALGSLPLISASMQRGELSYSKVRALTRIATPDNEAELLELARCVTASHVERVVRAWRRVDRLQEAEEERARHESRHVELYPDEDGSWVLRGRLDPEMGALLEKALEWARLELYGKRPEPGTSAGQRRADALGLVAEQALAASAAAPARRADRLQVVLHAERAALQGEPTEAAAASDAAAAAAPAGQSVLVASGQRVPAETSRRLSCDASLVEMTHELAPPGGARGRAPGGAGRRGRRALPDAVGVAGAGGTRDAPARRRGARGRSPQTRSRAGGPADRRVDRHSRLARGATRPRLDDLRDEARRHAQRLGWTVGHQARRRLEVPLRRGAWAAAGHEGVLDEQEKALCAVVLERLWVRARTRALYRVARRTSGPVRRLDQR
jgi:hypothetical protein